MYSELKYTVQFKCTASFLSTFHLSLTYLISKQIGHFEYEKCLNCLISSCKNNFENIMSAFYYYAFMFLLKCKAQLLNCMG